VIEKSGKRTENKAMPDIAMDLTWAQRDAIATCLYKGNWRVAVLLVPPAARELLTAMCLDCNLSELAKVFDPRSDGVIVDAADYNSTHYAPND
jgi:hypothetical protein